MSTSASKEKQSGARRPLRPWQTGVVLVVMLAIGVLLGAVPLNAKVQGVQSVWLRGMLARVTGPLASFSGALGLDEPWAQAAALAGRDSGGAVGTETESGAAGSHNGEAGGGGGQEAGLAPSGISSTSSLSTSGETPADSVASATGPPAAVTTTTTTTTVPLPAGAVSTSTSTTLPLFTKERPLRVLVVGDSLVLPVGQGLQRQAQKVPALKVKVISKTSSGLVRPDFYNWPKVLAATVSEFRPDVTVMMFGGNEKQNMKHEGRYLTPFSEEWTAEYTRRVREAMEMTLDAGGRVVWIGLPIMRSEAFSKTARTLNSIYQSVCAEYDGATYVDGYALFADDQGKYSAYLVDDSGKRKLVREKDGIHLTGAGGDRVAVAIMEVLRLSFVFGP